MAVDAQCRPSSNTISATCPTVAPRPPKSVGTSTDRRDSARNAVDRLSREPGVTIDLGGGNAGDILADPLSLAGQGVAEAGSGQLHHFLRPPL